MKLNLKKIKTIAIITIALIAVTVLPFLVYSNILIHIQSSILPDIGKSIGIDNLKGNVVNIGMFSADITSISNSKNLSIDSMKITYSPSVIFNNKIKTIDFYGTKLKASIKNGELIFDEVDLSKIINICSSKYEVKKCNINNSTLNLTFNNKSIQVPFNLEITPINKSWENINFKSSCKLFDSDLIFSGKYDNIKHQMTFAYSADLENINKLLNLCNIQKLKLNTPQGGVSGVAQIATNPIKLQSAKASGKIKCEQAKLKNIIIPANYADFSFSFDDKLSFAGDITLTTCDTNDIKFNTQEKISLKVVGDYRKGINAITKTPFKLDCTYRNNNIICNNVNMSLTEKNIICNASEFVLKSQQIELSALAIALSANYAISDKLQIFNIKSKIANVSIQKDSKVMQFAMCAITGKFKICDLGLDSFSLNSNIFNGNFVDEKNNIVATKFSCNIPLVANKYYLNKKITADNISFKSEKTTFANSNFQFSAPKLEAIAGIEFIDNSLENYGLKISAKKAKLVDVKRNIIANDVAIVLPISNNLKAKGSLSTNDFIYNNKSLGKLNLELEANKNIYSSKGSLIYNKQPDMKFAIDAILKPISNDLSVKIEAIDYIPKKNIKLKNAILNGKISILANLIYNDDKMIKNTLHCVGENMFFQSTKHNIEIKNANGDLFFADLSSSTSNSNNSIIASEISVDKLKLNNCRITFQVDKFAQIAINKFEGLFKSSIVTANPFQINLDSEGENEKITLKCPKIPLSEIFNIFTNVEARTKAFVGGEFIINERKLKSGIFNTSLGIKNNLKLFKTDSMLKGLQSDTNIYRQKEFSKAILEDFNYNWIKLKLNIEGKKTVLSVQLDGKPAKAIPFYIDKNTGQCLNTDNPKLQFDRSLEMDIQFKQ